TAIHIPKLILLSLLCLSGAVHRVHACTQGAAIRISVDFRNALLTETFPELERQSGCSFEYRHELFSGNNPRVSLHAEALPLDRVMHRLLANTGLTHRRQGGSILILAGTDDHPQPRTGRLRGRVTDAGGQPLAGASVTLVQTATTRQTAADGSYIFPSIA